MADHLGRIIRLHIACLCCFGPVLHLVSAPPPSLRRPWLRGFNVKTLRGAHAPVAAALDAASLDASTKYVTWEGALVRSEAGVWPLPPADSARMYNLVQRWIHFWKRDPAIAAASQKLTTSGSAR